jgi:5-methylthioadenosine/S-adenosylhomocysteine deaminase
MTRTRISAEWIVGFKAGSHHTLRDGIVVVDGDRIEYVGPPVEVEGVDRAVDYGRGSVLTPGLISTHAHIQESPVDKSMSEDATCRQFYYTNLIEVLPIKGRTLDRDARMACAVLSAAELLRTGCTTVVQLGSESAEVMELLRPIGIRAYLADAYSSGHWFTPDGNRVDYEWDEARGEAGLAQALESARAIRAAGDPRYLPLLGPAQVDTCSEALLRATVTEAEREDLLVSLHVAQGLWEFNEMVARHGRTPIEWLADIGFLSPRALLGHAVYVTGNSWVNYHGDDLGLIADSGATVSHNAWTFAREGVITESLDRYLAAGVPMTLGTDTATQSMIESLRWSAILGKVADRRADISTARDVFDAATIAAADYLGRPDLGRIEAGAQADLVVWRGESMFMTPLRDPIRNLVYYAQAEDVQDVYVAGALVVEDSRVLGADVAEATATVQRASDRAWGRWAEFDRLGRDIAEALPESYPRW